ncbi:hypothetical protein VCHENC02_5471A, partial [Vibrio harveyi]
MTLVTFLIIQDNGVTRIS